MLHEEISEPDAVTPADVRERYERELAAVVDDAGVEAAAAETGVERERVEALVAGEGPTLSVEEATDLLALSPDRPDGETLRLELRDHVMLQMSSAVLDVDALAAELDGLDSREVQQKIEGRQRMTLAEYARVHHLIASENPY